MRIHLNAIAYNAHSIETLNNSKCKSVRKYLENSQTTGAARIATTDAASVFTTPAKPEATSS
jgi:hypothetical protein